MNIKLIRLERSVFMSSFLRGINFIQSKKFIQLIVIDL